jgi:hypothetical protein
MNNDLLAMAREQISQCWSEPENSHKEMDTVLAESMTRVLANWIEVAQQYANNTDYYRNLVIRCGSAIGNEAYIQDDGNKSPDVLCAKVPELVEALCAKLNDFELNNWRFG